MLARRSRLRGRLFTASFPAQEAIGGSTKQLPKRAVTGNNADHGLSAVIMSPLGTMRRHIWRASVASSTLLTNLQWNNWKRGIYIFKYTFDSALRECCWHRAALKLCGASRPTVPARRGSPCCLIITFYKSAFVIYISLIQMSITLFKQRFRPLRSP